MIEKYLHLIWLPPNLETPKVPKEAQSAVELWQTSEPNIKVKLWETAELESELTSVDGRNVWQAVQSCHYPSMKADIASLGLVYKNGGFWSGLKNRPLATFVEHLAELDGFIAPEHFPVGNRPDPVNYICNCFFGSGKGNHFVLECLDQALANIADKKSSGPPSITGSQMLADVRQKMDRKGTHIELRVISYGDFWGRLVKRIPQSYDSNDMHWSKRQKREPLYN